MSSVANYVTWMHGEANRVLDPWSPMHDDLVQEGLLAAWQQEKKRGEHAGFMTNQAALQMRSVARGQAMTGSTHKGVASSVKPVVSFDQFDSPTRDLLSPESADLADRAMIAYHHGEIHQAIDRLPAKQKQAVQSLMLDGVLSARERAAWSEARVKLAIELDHLRGMCL